MTRTYTGYLKKLDGRTKEVQREQLASDVDAYLALGKKIKCVGSEANRGPFTNLLNVPGHPNEETRRSGSKVASGEEED